MRIGVRLLRICLRLLTRNIHYVVMSRARTLLEVFYKADLEEERQKMMLNIYNL